MSSDNDRPPTHLVLRARQALQMGEKGRRDSERKWSGETLCEFFLNELIFNIRDTLGIQGPKETDTLLVVSYFSALRLGS